MTEQQGVTAKEMCELIARYLKETQGVDIAPEAIYNASPKGALTDMILLYNEAKAFYEHDEKLLMQFLKWLINERVANVKLPEDKQALIAEFFKWREQQ